MDNPELRTDNREFLRVLFSGQRFFSAIPQRDSGRAMASVVAAERLVFFQMVHLGAGDPLTSSNRRIRISTVHLPRSLTEQQHSLIDSTSGVKCLESTSALVITRPRWVSLSFPDTI